MTGSTHAKPTQRTQLRTEAGGSRQGQPHRGAPNGYDAERGQRSCLGRASGRHKEPGSRPASTCPAQPHSKSGVTAPGLGKGTTATGRPTEAPRATGPDEARRTTQGHKARQRGTPPATAKVQGQLPSNNGHRVPQTREARPTHDELGHRSRCQGKPGPYTGPPQPQPVGSGPRPHAPRTGGRAWESARPRTPHTQARGAPSRAPSRRPHSAQSRLARACALGLVTGLHAHTRCTHSQWVAGPSRAPQPRAVGPGRAPNPGRPTSRQEVPPRGALEPPRQRAKPARQSPRCGVGDGCPRPPPLHPQPLDRGPRPHAPRTGGRAWESAQPRTPQAQIKGPPPRGRPRAAPTARKASTQGRTLWR